MNKRTVFLEGTHIFLGPLNKEDNLSAYLGWINDEHTTTFMGSGRFPSTLDGIRAYIDRYDKSEDGMLLGIFLRDSSIHIGNITLHMIDWRNRYGEIGIIIGNTECRGKGYASDALKLIIGHAFNRLNLRKLYAGMVDGNDASKGIFEKAGFQQEGVLREHFYLNGSYLDCYRYGLLKNEYLIIRSSMGKNHKT